MSIPHHLVSTVELLNRAYPSGVPEDESLVVMHLLYPYMADKNLSEAIAVATERPGGLVLNDVYRAADGAQFPGGLLATVRARLNAAGFQAWTDEES